MRFYDELVHGDCRLQITLNGCLRTLDSGLGTYWNMSRWGKVSLFYSDSSDVDDCNSHLVHFSSGTRQIRCFSVGSARCR